MTDNMNTLGTDDVAPATPPRAPRLQALLVLFIVAIAGVVAGIVLERTVLRPHVWSPRMAQRTDRRGAAARRPSAMLPAELKLTEEQAVRVDTLIERQMHGFRDIRQSTQPAIDSLMAQTKRSMDSILTPTQRAVLDSSRTKREAEFRKRFPNGAPQRGPNDWGRPPMPRP
jgi:Spy/CpxP family protein refolding chaperone